jgi:hypothetical protein
MPTFRDREREEAAAQLERTSAQRDELKKRAANRVKERGKAGGLGAATSHSTAGFATRPGASPSGAGGPTARSSSLAGPRGSTASNSQLTRPPRPQHGPKQTQWGLSPSEWRGDVGAELVTLQSQNFALRREREAWELERLRLENAAKARGVPKYGRGTSNPSPPPSSIRSGGGEDDEDGPRVSRGVPKPTTRNEVVGMKGAESLPPKNPSNPGSRKGSRPASRETHDEGAATQFQSRRHEIIDDVFAGGQENTPPRGNVNDDDEHDFYDDESPDASRAVASAVQHLSGAEGTYCNSQILTHYLPIQH